MKRTEIESDKELILAREIELEKLKHSFEMRQLEAKEAGLFAEARGGVFSCVNKGQRDNNNKGAAQSNPERKA